MGLFDLFRKKEMKTPQGPMADLFSSLTMEQKFSVMQLYSLCNVTCFENFKNSKISYEILMAASKSLGVSIQQADRYFEAHGQFENLIFQIKTIKDHSILDVILMDLIRMLTLSDGEKRDQRYDLVSRVYEALGYTQDDIVEKIKKAILMADVFNL